MFVSSTCSSSSFLGLANAWPGAGEWQERSGREGAGGGQGALAYPDPPSGRHSYGLELCDRDAALNMPTLSLPISHSFLGKKRVDGSNIGGRKAAWGRPSSGQGTRHMCTGLVSSPPMNTW